MEVSNLLTTNLKDFIDNQYGILATFEFAGGEMEKGPIYAPLDVWIFYYLIFFL